MFKWVEKLLKKFDRHEKLVCGSTGSVKANLLADKQLRNAKATLNNASCVAQEMKQYGETNHFRERYLMILKGK